MDMNDFAMPTESHDAPSRRLTGLTVLLYLLGFFAVVAGVNGVLVYESLSTLRGLDTDSAYQAGRTFERDVAMAKAQDARHWRVDAKLTPAPDGARLDIDARDAVGRPLAGMDAIATFERPTDRNLDREVAVTESAPGHFSGSADLAPGQWDLVIELSRRGEREFRSVNRVMLR